MADTAKNTNILLITAALLLIIVSTLAYAQPYGGGNGTEEAPYLISDPNHMQTIGTDPNDWSKHFKLINDIDLSGFTGMEFNIIGSDTKPFSGVFDGDGHIISNFTYNSSGADYIGLFAYVDDPNAEIKHLYLTSPNIDGGSNNYIGSLVGCMRDGTITDCNSIGGNISGKENVGGLVGASESIYGNIRECHSSVSISVGDSSSSVGGLVGNNENSTIIDSYSTGDILAGELSDNVGGLVGSNTGGTIVHSHSIGDVTLEYRTSNVGGLVGWNNGYIGDCSATGEIIGEDNVGGLVGQNYNGSIIKSFSTGIVTGAGIQIDEYLGGLVGVNIYGIITKCFTASSVLGYRYVGGLVGHSSGGSISSCYAIGDATGEWKTGGFVGYNGGRISNCYAMGSAGSVAGENWIGGFVGINSGAISNCYALGFATGDGSYVGGFAGTSNIGGISSCFWDMDTGGPNNGRGTPLTTAEMHDPNIFLQAGWDFLGEMANGTSEIWQMPFESHPDLSYFQGYLPLELSGEGILEEPYLIHDANELGAVFHYDPHACYQLETNIDYSTITWSTPPIPGFAGCFNGNGHTISELDVGFVGFLGQGGEIKGLGLTEINVEGGSGCLVGSNYYASISDCYAIGSIVGVGIVGGLVGSNRYGSISDCHAGVSVSGEGDQVGGLVGSNYHGSISDCNSTGIVSGIAYIGGLVGRSWGSHISNCTASGSVIGDYDYVGGLVGFNYGSISDCYASGTVSGDTDYIGGLVGKNDGGILNCYATGFVSGTDDFVGGLVGDNGYGSISSCYASGPVSGDERVGGLVGNNYGSISNCFTTVSVEGDYYVGGFVGMDYGSITNCYSSGTVSGIQDVGAFLGYGYGDAYINCFWDSDINPSLTGVGNMVPDPNGIVGRNTSEMKDPLTFLNSGWDYVGEIVNGTNEAWQVAPDSYPALSIFNGYIPTLLKGEGTQLAPYLIHDANDLGAIIYYKSDAFYRLEADINLSDINWSASPIPCLFGCFNGNGYVVTGLNINGGGHLGLIGYLGFDGEIKDLGLTDLNLEGAGNSVGGMVGDSFEGTLTSCFVATGSITGNNAIGGLVGRAGGFVDYPAGSISNCYATASVAGTSDIGGLVGSTREGSYSNCYATGPVTGDNNVGALLGYDSGRASYVSCFWDSDINPSLSGIGNRTNPDVLSRTTVQMQMQATYTDYSWDFVEETANGTEDIWDICEGMNYPKFFWEIPIGDFVCPDGVGMEDLLLLVSAWLSNPGDDNWLPDCDISDPKDNIVNGLDFGCFSGNWQKGL